MATSPKITQKLLLTGEPIEALKLKLLEIRRDREEARKSGRAWTTVASLHRLEADILRQLADIKTVSTQVDPLDALSDEELEALASGAEPSTQEGEPPALRLVGAR